MHSAGMEINLLLFGQVAEIAGSSSIVLTDIADTTTLKTEMNKRFPALADIKYAVSVDKQLVMENTNLSDSNTVALLPPFSGG
jgi:sulfur-carrier protein